MSKEFHPIVKEPSPGKQEDTGHEVKAWRSRSLDRYDNAALAQVIFPSYKIISQGASMEKDDEEK